MRSRWSALVWFVSLLVLGVGALAAGQMVLMATSLDPAASVSDGGEAWWDAIVAGAEFLGLALVCAIALALWHTRRFKPVALVLLAVQIAAVGWACVHIYEEYF